MSYTYEITHRLVEYDEILYKMIQIKVSSTDTQFFHKSFPVLMTIDDGMSDVSCFTSEISLNQKEVNGYFTIDAFTGFLASSTLEVSYGPELIHEFTGVDVTSVPTLDTFDSSIPHTDATNAWLATL